MIATERNTRRDKYLESFAMQLADTDVPLPKGALDFGPFDDSSDVDETSDEASHRPCPT